MKHLGTILGAVSLVGVIGLSALHFSGKSNKQSPEAGKGNSAKSDMTGKVAYFVMDSVESKYEYIKQAREELKREEERMANELTGLRDKYMGRIQQLKQKESTMSMEEGQSAQNEIDQMQRNLADRDRALGEALATKQAKMLKEINEAIEQFVTEYNKDKKYAYIISHQQGDMIFFKDSTLDITKEVVEGLNKKHSARKAAKP